MIQLNSQVRINCPDSHYHNRLGRVQKAWAWPDGTPSSYYVEIDKITLLYAASEVSEIQKIEKSKIDI
jgi:hypothetical protein